MSISVAQCNLEELQAKDDSITWILSELKSGRKPEWEDVSGMNTDVQNYWNQWESLKIKEKFFIDNVSSMIEWWIRLLCQLMKEFQY